MDSDEELPFSESENQPSPVPVRKLKRLRKATEKLTKDLPSPSSHDAPSGHEVNSSASEALVYRGETNTEDFEVLSPRSGSRLEVLEQGFKFDSGFETEEVEPAAKRHLIFDSLSEGFDGKGGDRLDTEVEEESEDLRTNEVSEKKWRNLGEFDEVGAGAKRHLGFDSFSEEFDGKGEEKLEETEDLRPNDGSEKKRRNLDGFEEVGPGAKRNLVFDSFSEDFDGKGEDKLDTEVEESEDLRTNEGSEKKRKNSDEFEENGEKKRKKKKVKNANDVYDENLFSAVSPKKIGKKERRERLKELRAESQRLLRETREASFKPVPIIQKSVSSVLEKIRQRKQELSKKLVNMTESSYTDGNTISREAHKDADIDREELTSIPVAAEGSVEAQDVQGSKETSNESDENVTVRMAKADDLKQTFRAPVEDSQDLIFDSPESDSKDEIPSSPLEDVLAPLKAMNLKFDSALPDDFSDDEEDNNKNIDPLRHCSADLISYHKGDPVKAFVDDEAEEEDDSDDDRARFQDNEEDEDDMDSAELNDMIATAYEEQPVDNEMRNQLHQKWLEQQDAAGTENLLQRLKCDSKQREPAFMEEREDEASEEREDEESEEEFDNDPAEGLVPRNVVRMNLKKAKEMIPLMFTDKDDVYVSSDDEETEKTLLKRHLSHKTEEKSTFLSPAEDASSKDIFGLIKKLNGAPDARRKAKIASYSNTLSLGGNRTTSSKLSFLSRGSRNSLPSIQKHGSSTVRSFVFERDDSNSRSAILTAEDSSDTVQRENRPKKSASAKFSNSQVKTSSQSTQNKSGPSLHEILRCPPPLQSSHRTGGNIEDIYVAFKLDQYPIKKEPGLSIRTA